MYDIGYCSNTKTDVAACLLSAMHTDNPITMTNLSGKLLWLFLILMLSAYVVYEHATNCLATDLSVQIERHQNMLAGKSEFFNPWQYRIFSMWMLEGFINVFERLLPGKPAILPYLLLHYLQIALVFVLFVVYVRHLGVDNFYLLAIGLLIICFCMANSYFKSDLSFNTYFDLAFYLLGAILILKHAFWWIVPLAVVAAFNRETSGFIPLMLLAPFSPQEWKKLPKERWLPAVAAMLLFVAVFVAVRLYYGYQPGQGIHGITNPVDHLKFNLTFFRLYPLLIGTLGIVPFVVLFGLNRLPAELRFWFWLIVPLWFVIHFVKSNAMETRLFLVPQVLIFVPALLYLTQFSLLPSGTAAASKPAQ